MQRAIISSKNDIFLFDCVTKEQSTSKLRITKNPVEHGAQIADHAILEPKILEITGYMAIYEVSRDYTGISQIDDALNSVINPFKTAYRFTNAMNELSKDILKTEFKTVEVREIAPFLGSFSEPYTNFMYANNRLSEAYTKLLDLQKSGELLEVQTGLMLFKNMLLASIVPLMESDNYFEVSLTFEEVFIVESKMVDGLQIEKTKIAKSSNKNKSVAKPKEENISALKKMEKVANGIFN